MRCNRGKKEKKKKQVLLSTQISRILTVNVTLYDDLMIKISKTPLLYTLDFFPKYTVFQLKKCIFYYLLDLLYTKIDLKGVLFLNVSKYTKPWTTPSWTGNCDL